MSQAALGCTSLSLTRSSSREVRIRVPTVAVVYFTRVPNPPNQKRGERSGTTGGPKPWQIQSTWAQEFGSGLQVRALGHCFGAATLEAWP